MKRTIIKIDEEKCNGCGLCVNSCQEGALQLIDDKARIISELYCDGLGACIGECPVGAIVLEEREAEPYNEEAVMKRISQKGQETILAHLNHLKNHGEMQFFSEGVEYLKKNNIKIDLGILIENDPTPKNFHSGGCPGMKVIDFKDKDDSGNVSKKDVDVDSQLRQWPVQLHLLTPLASYIRNADLVLAADCVAFAHGNFHNHFLKGKSLAIACPKLDNGKEIYIEKISSMIDEAKINTLNVLMMEVPCCGGLLQIAKLAVQASVRKIPIKSTIISIKGDIISEEWI